MSAGTPATLLQAIENALEEYEGTSAGHVTSPCGEIVRRHVQDFLAQKFQIAMIQANQGRFSTESDVKRLFDVCVKKSMCLNRE